ncbi:uncharacterized protein LOC135216018 [Macrobrachium nipponense]|uniref:uncharacterized protein LOC135216018 n=1 Tax=Macrobrachium nipponense TaxID=159736 RepID=UPI0030C882B9
MGNTALEVDETGALLIILALIKLMLISTQGVFPIDMNTFFKDLWSRQKRELEPHPNAIALYDNKTLYQHPEVELMPCTRRFLCEMENAAKTSDKYLPRGPDVSYDTNPDEEVAPEEVDPLSEMHIEAVRALFREDDSPGDLSPRCQKALSIVDGLTGPVCEKAYRLCPGRYTSSLVYRTIFDEMNLVVHDSD